MDWLPLSQNVIRVCGWCDKVILFIIHLENTSKKTQHRSKVNYVKIFLVEQVPSKLNKSLRFMDKTL